MRSRAQINSHPIHPMLVVFPHGLFFGSWIFDLIGKATSKEQLWAASFYCTIVGLVGGFCAAIPGLIDWFTVKRRGLIHATLNTLVLIAFLIIAVHRPGSTAEPGAFELVLMTLAVIVLGISGWLGGTLSYRNQIGVDHRYANFQQMARAQDRKLGTLGLQSK